MFEKIKVRISEMESIKKDLQNLYLATKSNSVKKVIAERNMQLSWDLMFLKELLNYEQIK